MCNWKKRKGDEGEGEKKRKKFKVNSKELNRTHTQIKKRRKIRGRPYA